MNRKIAFRAWDNVNKVMQYSDIIWGDYDFPALSELNYGDNIYNLSNLMQYTGLKDKNGKEIYEGDIICNNNANWEVGFDEGGYWMRQREGQHKFIFINEAQHS